MPCVHGDTMRYPTVPVWITTSRGECQMRVGAVHNLPVLILLGRDCTLFQALWKDLGRSACEVGRRGKRTVACATHALWQEVSTGSEFNQEEGDDPAPGSEPLSEEDLRLPFMEKEVPDGLTYSWASSGRPS